MRSPLTAIILLGLIVLPEVTQAELTRAEMIAQLKTWKDSFSNVRIEYTTKVVEASGEMDDLGTVHKGVWVDTDSNRSHWHTFWLHNERSVNRRLWLANGDRQYMVEYPYDDSEFGQPHRVTVRPYAPIPSQITPLRGLGSDSGWLPDWLESGALQAELRNIGDQSQSEVSDQDAGFVITVDPEHSCLPVQYGNSYFVTEFQQSDGIWFPLRGRNRDFTGRIDNPDVIEWVIDRVEFNREIPESVFEPPISPDSKDVEVVDQITGFVGLRGEVDETGALVPATTPVHPSQVDQELSKQDWNNSLLLLLVLLAFAGIIIWQWVMRG